MGNTKYVHGYSDREALRLNDQADTLDHLIHNDTLFPNDSLVLEAGCGVGAQTKLITGSPHSISQDDLEKLIGSYDTNGKMGMGLVFVAENMNKATAKGSFYVCFFDLVTKKIIDAERMEGKASGVGFRNYWASTVYDVMKNWSPKK